MRGDTCWSAQGCCNGCIACAGEQGLGEEFQVSVPTSDEITTAKGLGKIGATLRERGPCLVPRRVRGHAPRCSSTNVSTARAKQKGGRSDHSRLCRVSAAAWRWPKALQESADDGTEIAQLQEGTRRASRIPRGRKGKRNKVGSSSGTERGRGVGVFSQAAESK